MSGQQAKVQDVSARKTWDREGSSISSELFIVIIKITICSEYAAKAKAKDEEEREIMQQKEEMIRQGKKPRTRAKEELPKPTQLMKQRESSLELDKNLGKTMIVQNPGARGPGQPGFYCEVCNRTHKDSAGYLDHLNSRQHLRRLGQSTKIERSTVEQVRARIALLREQTKAASQAKAFDFDKRLAEIKAKEDQAREEKKMAKKAARDAARMEIVKDTVDQAEENEMASLMGFSGFGSSKK